MSSIFNYYKSGFWEQVEKHWNILIYIITVNFFHPVDHECLQETRKRFVARLYCYFHSAVYWKSFLGALLKKLFFRGFNIFGYFELEKIGEK